MILELTKAEVREAVAKVMSFLMAGKDDDEIAELMGLTPAQLEQIKKELLNREAERLTSRDSEEIYADYVVQQLACIRDLVRVQKDFKDNKNPSVLVGAIRARSEIIDKIVDRGQDLGFIIKTPERKHITGGILVAEMSNADLRKAILSELQTVQTMMKEIGGGGRDLMDIDVGPLHRPIEETPEGFDVSRFKDRDKCSKSKKVKVHSHGRKSAPSLRDPVIDPVTPVIEEECE
jgi:hypothetical protein